MIAITAFLIYFSYFPIFKFIIAIILAVFMAVAIIEFAKILRAKGIIIPKTLMVGAGVFELFAFLLSLFSHTFKMAPLVILFLFAFFIFSVNLMNIKGAIESVATSILCFMYVVIPFGMMMIILFISSYGVYQDGRMWLFYLLAVTKVADIGGYFGGKTMGKHSLAATISPKKTWEGTVSGLVLSLAVSLVFYYYSNKYLTGIFDLDLFYAILLGVLLGTVGQMGDLFESLIKRDAKVKDSNQLPGMGGVLDMFDSLLFNIPIVFFFLTK